MHSPKPNGDRDLGERVSRLEASVDHLAADVRELHAEVREIHRDIVTVRTVDFRILFGAVIASTLGIAGILARVFGCV